MKYNGKEIAYKDLPESVKTAKRRASKKWRDKTPLIQRQYAKRNAKKKNDTRYAKRQAMIYEIKAKAGCATCLERDPRCLVFHHTNPAEKLFTIGNGFSLSLPKLLAEIAKCVVMCSNCHMKLHRGGVEMGGT